MQLGSEIATWLHGHFVDGPTLLMSHDCSSIGNTCFKKGTQYEHQARSAAFLFLCEANETVLEKKANPDESKTLWQVVLVTQTLSLLGVIPNCVIFVLPAFAYDGLLGLLCFHTSIEPHQGWVWNQIRPQLYSISLLNVSLYWQKKNYLDALVDGILVGASVLNIWSISLGFLLEICPGNCSTS